MKKLILASMAVAIRFAPGLTPAQTHTDGSKAPGSTSGSGSSGSETTGAPSMPPSADTPSTPGTPAPRPSTGSPSTPSSRGFTYQADCERAGGKWHASRNKWEVGG